MADTVQGLRLLEREQQVNGLESVLEAAQGGSGRTVVVKGGAGIGKTALLDAAADAARVRGFEVLTARADELESELSFGVCLQVFEPVAGEPHGGNGGGDPFAGAAGLARPILDTTVTITPAVGEDRILSLIHGLYWLCANIADNDPLLLVVDDAHWGDVPSLRFLHFLSRRLDGLRAVVLVAARPDGARPPADRLLDAITGEAAGNAIEPGPLSAGAVATMIEEELGAAEPGFARSDSAPGRSPSALRPSSRPPGRARAGTS